MALLESVYEAALCYQLRKDGLRVENQVKLSVIYDGHVLPVDLRLDVLVEDKVIVELKSVTEMKRGLWQTASYLSENIPS